MGRSDFVAVRPGGAAGAPAHQEPAAAEIVWKVRHPEMTRRERLLRGLSAVPGEVPVILLTAPAGYGKTAVLEQWAETDRRRFGWVRLEDADNDPVRLLRRLALALHGVRPIDYPAWRSLRPPNPARFDAGVTRLIAAATGDGLPWVLVLENLHVLRGGLAADLVLALAKHLPAGYHVVAAGRSQAGLLLSELRRQGRCVEIGPRELAFTVDEVAGTLAAADVRPTAGATEGVFRRTEGWPAGVYLTALAARDGLAVPGEGEPLAGTDFVFAYLREEVLRHEPPEVVRFLRRIAVLDRMSAPLCDAVAGDTGAAARLADLESRNLFVSRPDPGRLWYRFHPMFRDLLLMELRRHEPTEEAAVHRRAAGWCADHGFAAEAVTHALAAGDRAVAARMVLRHGPGYLNAGRLSNVRHWLTALSGGAMPGLPEMAVFAGWTWALVGDADRAQECLHAAEQGVFGRTGARLPADPPSDRADALVSAVAELRAGLAPFGVKQMLQDAQRAFGLARPGSPGYSSAGLLLGVAQLLTGNAEAARSQLEDSAQLGRERHPIVASFALAQLSLIAADEDDWAVAESCATEAADLVRAGRLVGYPSSIPAYLSCARLAVHRRDLNLARHHANQAAAVYEGPSPVAFPWLAAQSACELARVFLHLDDHPAALRRMADARRHLARLSDAGTLSRRCAELDEEIARHGDRLRYPDAVALTAAEMRVLQLLPTHLTLAEIADALYISRNTVKTHVAAIYAKLQSSTRAEAVRAAREQGLLG